MRHAIVPARVSAGTLLAAHRLSYIVRVHNVISLVKTTRPLDTRRPAPDSPGAQVHSDESTDTTVIPVMQEELDVRTRRVETQSGVRVSKTVDEREEVVDEPLTKEEVEVERVSMNVPVDAPSGVRYEGDTMIIPIFEEIVVVEKRLILKEEIRVTRRRENIRAAQRVTLRREMANVERIEDTRARANRAGAETAPASDADSLLEAKRQEQEHLRRSLSSPTRRE
jgi:uncharacterized protein (TIGR02271 family)